jgi:hypothetical protein
MKLVKKDTDQVLYKTKYMDSRVYYQDCYLLKLYTYPIFLIYQNFKKQINSLLTQIKNY